MVGCACCIVYVFVWASSGILAWNCGKGPSLDHLKDLLGSFGGIAAFLALVGVWYTGRINARSVNREAWVVHVREALAPLIADLPSYNLKLYDSALVAAQMRSAKNLVTLALHLDLFKPDQRTIMALLHWFYRLRGETTITARERTDYEKLGLRTDPAQCQDAKVWHERKEQLIRIADIYFYREWEKVKHAK